MPLRPRFHIYRSATGRVVATALAELSVSIDAADRHLLVYGYNNFHRMTVMNLRPGHLAPITVDRPTIGSPFSCAAW